MLLTVIVLAKNEEKNIVRCVNSLLFCDEILIVDDNSTDSTVRKIKSLHDPKIKVFSRDLVSFSDQRNWAIEKAEGVWVLFIDADEIVSPKLQSEIQKNIDKGDFDAFRIKREDILWGKRMKRGELLNFRLTRLAKKNAGKWIGAVHEVWDVQGAVGVINEPILHVPHESISNFLDEVDNYSTIRSEELFSHNVSSNVFSIILYPLSKFIVNYFFKKGFLEGNRGLILALMMTLHSFLVRAKLYLLVRH